MKLEFYINLGILFIFSLRGGFAFVDDIAKFICRRI